MIVISGALVLVALVLLIIGVVGPDLAFVYASIGVSLVSLVFLVVGVLQRRDEPATEPATELATEPEAAQVPQSVAVDDPAEGTTVRPSSVRRAPDATPETGASGAAEVDEDEVDEDEVDEVEAPVADTVDAPPAPGGDVLVVEGRPRYHVVGCRYLSGKTPEAVEVGQARDEGFTPCGVCKPDVALAALAEEEAEESAYEPGTSEPLLDAPASPGEDQDGGEDADRDDDGLAAEETGPAPVVEEDVPGVEVAPPVRRTAPPTATPTATRTVARATPAAKAAARRTAARTASAADAPARTASARGGSVVVIPERGRYHREACRYVRAVGGAEVLSRSAATRQGYAPCGVCKP